MICLKSAATALMKATLVLAIATALSAAHAQTFTTLYSFMGSPDGNSPQSNLLDLNGTLYGTTGVGGAYGYGTIFRLNKSGKETVLYSFTGGTDGRYPNSGLVPDKQGHFYGTTQNGGDLSCNIISSFFVGCGVVYKLDSTGHFSVLYAFTDATDGAFPQGVVLDSAGSLYGTSAYGGDLNCPLFPGIGCGVVFRLSSQSGGWTETVLYAFLGSNDGATPNGFLTRDKAGNLYGATYGSNLTGCSGIACGVVFKVNTNKQEAVLYTFTGGADGAGPNGNLLMDGKGNLYGTAYEGGDLNCSVVRSTRGCGVVFKITPAHHEVVIHTFEGVDGANPDYGFVADAKGNGYGTTTFGGPSNFGTVFEITSKGAEIVLHSFTGGADGSFPESSVIIDKQGSLYSTTNEGGDISCDPQTGCGTVFKIVP